MALALTQGQEFCLDGFRELMLLGEPDSLGLQGFAFVGEVRATPVTYPNAGSHQIALLTGQIRSEDLALLDLEFLVKLQQASVPWES